MSSGADVLGEEERWSVIVGIQKTGETAMKLAALGLSYATASGWAGTVKSTLCRWLQREPLDRPTLTGRVLELDGLWTGGSPSVALLSFAAGVPASGKDGNGMVATQLTY